MADGWSADRNFVTFRDRKSGTVRQRVGNHLTGFTQLTYVDSRINALAFYRFGSQVTTLGSIFFAMNSPDVAAALHAGAPDAAGQLYDAHAEAMFQYSWLTLRNRQHAQTAVIEALVQAGARVAELSDPGTLRAWLFTLVRAEGHRHPLPSLGDTDEAIARPEQQDSALRIMAWNSVMSLDLVERQALDLNTRHGMTAPEISLILGVPLAGITELLACATVTLERALGAQILVSRDTQECPGRTEAIHGWTGTVTPAFRDRLLDHAASCPICQPRLPRNVSPSRIFGLLPAPTLDREVRGQVIALVADRVQAQAAELEADPVLPSKPDLSVLAAAVSALIERVPAERAAAEPALPDVVEPDPVVPDPAGPSPIIADPAIAPDASPEASPDTSLDARPDEPPVEHHELPADLLLNELDALLIDFPDHDVAEPGDWERGAQEATALGSPVPAEPLGTRSSREAQLPREAGSPQRSEQTRLSQKPHQPQKSQQGQQPQQGQRSQRPPQPPAPPRPAPSHGHRSGPKPKKRRGIRLFAGLGAALLAVGIAAGLTYGSLGTSRAQLSGSVSRDVPGGGSSVEASGGPLPSPYAPSPTLHSHGPDKKSIQISPAAGHADAVASDKTGSGKRTIVTRGQGPHQTVTVALRPRASSSSHTQAAAQLTVSPANVSLGTESSMMVKLSVSGGSMSWTASPSSGISVNPSSGRLGNGDSTPITISVPGQRSSGGSGVVSINGAQVSVSWAATATPSSPPSSGSSGSSGPSSPPARTNRHHHQQPDPGGSPDPGSS
jgi:DNA-directed RNA polymerase specialized sigma24 family protein